eukprot:m.124475 g.124475  ORF g.124475 m.124475 type:complete len:367 (-) comp9425_c5_seq1:1667-2767(-)
MDYVAIVDDNESLMLGMDVGEVNDDVSGLQVENNGLIANHDEETSVNVTGDTSVPTITGGSFLSNALSITGASQNETARKHLTDDDIHLHFEAQPLEDRRWLQLLFAREYPALKQMLQVTPKLVKTKEFFTGGNALHYAVRLGDANLFHILLGGDYMEAINAQNFEGNTPLHLAYTYNVQGKNDGIIERLLMLGSDVDCLNCGGLVPDEMKGYAVCHPMRLPLRMVEAEEKKGETRERETLTIITNSSNHAHHTQNISKRPTFFNLMSSKRKESKHDESRISIPHRKGALYPPEPGAEEFVFPAQQGLELKLASEGENSKMHKMRSGRSFSMIMTRSPVSSQSSATPKAPKRRTTLFSKKKRSSKV